MAGVHSAALFEDLFHVTQVNPEGKKFDRVDRIVCKGETYEVELFLDVASEEYRLRAGDKFTMTLTTTLNLDGTPDADEYVNDGKPNLLDEYEYGMCGKVFKYEHLSDKKVAAVASFGGLLMMLKGEQRYLVRIALDQKVYALIRKDGGKGAT
jgi:DNA-directed RNA polymerase I, II, and III subunit RPABC3